MYRTQPKNTDPLLGFQPLLNHGFGCGKMAGFQSLVMTYKPSQSVQRCDLWTRARNKKRHGKKPDSDKLAIRQDHPRCHSAIWICACSGNGYTFQVSRVSEARGVEIHPLSLTCPVAYTTACTSLQAVKNRVTSLNPKLMQLHICVC